VTRRFSSDGKLRSCSRSCGAGFADWSGSHASPVTASCGPRAAPFADNALVSFLGRRFLRTRTRPEKRCVAPSLAAGPRVSNEYRSALTAAMT